MRLLLLTLLTITLASCSMWQRHNHEFTEHKKHMHAGNCGHKMVKHGDHKDYIHNGEYHQELGTGKLAIHGNTRDKSNKLASSEHDHKHGKKCGHDKVKHGKHWDYLHDGEYHRAHKKHVDLHGDNKDS